MADLPAPAHEGSEPERFSEAPVIELGQWYWVKPTDDNGYDADDDLPTHEWLGCVLDLGSNYIYIEAPPTGKYGSSTHTRVHTDDFWNRCRREMKPREFIQGRIAHFKAKVESALLEIRALTANLGVTPTTGIEQAEDGSTRSLSVLSTGQSDLRSYKRSLIKAKEKTIPDLFKLVEESSTRMANWMKAEILPFQASIGPMKGCIELIEERVFHVELYAGLTEQVVKVQDGKPAASHEKVKLMQGRLYMDEECLLDYDAGGMEFRDIRTFDRWITRPHNLAALLPHQRCMVAMQVRRKEKKRAVDNILDVFVRMALKEQDERTFFYIRNGEQVFRLSTDQELRAKLFPDLSEFDFTQPMMIYAGHHDVSLMKRSEFEERSAKRVRDEAENDAKHEQWMKEHPGENSFMSPYDHPHYGFDPRGWTPFDRSNVVYDDATKAIERDMKYYNRIVLILQGLFDRSPVFSPHFPAQLWNTESFNRVVELVYDRDRALYAGNKPDFEAFRKQCNASIGVGSVVVGMEDTWAEKEEAEENARGGPRYNRFGQKIEKYQRYADPGPGFLSVVSAVRGEKVTCKYIKPRQKSEYPNKYSKWTPVDGMAAGDPMDAFFTTTKDKLFNASAYTPGDYKLFLSDPRTRAEYLEWAPYLLGSEDFASGKRKPDTDRMKDGRAY